MATNSAIARTAETQAVSGPNFVSTPSRSPDKKSVPSESSASSNAQPNGSDDTNRGLSRRQAYDAGMRRAMASYINSPLMEQLSLELTLTRATLRAVSDTAMQRERLLLHWQNEARWWQEEYGRLSSEYSAFVKAVARIVK